MAPRLSELSVLFVDCQTTGATPEKGELLDLAWSVGNGSVANGSVGSESGGLAVGGGLLAIDDELPRRIARLTGVTSDLLVDATPRPQMQRQFAAALEAHDGPVVAHYARFERRFLDHFMETTTAWPRPLVCTHAIARRLLPGLPRLGIRALSGYFGQSMDEEKRAAGHVRATARIWANLVELLAEEDVTTFAELEAWLETTDTPSRSSSTRRFPLPREVRLQLPEEPGVYRMLGRDKVVLYVGKATSLKARVNSYYRGRKGEGERKLELVTQVWELDVTPTPTPLHAAILENREIKAHEPAYNRQFRAKHRDIAFADPNDLSLIQRQPDSVHTFGPLPSLSSLDGAVWLLRALDGDFGELGFAEVDDEAIGEGLALFRAEADALGFDARAWTSPLALAELGAEFRRLDDEADEADDIDEEEEAEEAGGPADGEPTPWSSEDVAGYARWVAKGLARTRRRSQAFTTFREGDLAWVSPVTAARHLVRWRGGRVTETPDGFGVGTGGFDLEQYDETAVLIGELRRLIRYGAELELVTADQTFDRDTLAAFFTR